VPFFLFFHGIGILDALFDLALARTAKASAALERDATFFA